MPEPPALALEPAAAPHPRSPPLPPPAPVMVSPELDPVPPPLHPLAPVPPAMVLTEALVLPLAPALEACLAVPPGMSLTEALVLPLLGLRHAERVGSIGLRRESGRAGKQARCHDGEQPPYPHHRDPPAAVAASWGDVKPGVKPGRETREGNPR